MKQIRLSIMMVVFFASFFLTLPHAGGNTIPEWASVEKAINEGLPQTAIDHLKKIIPEAMKQGKLGEAVKALTQSIVLEGNIQGNKAEEKVTRLEKEIETAAPDLQPILRVVLAHWYWHFFQQNRWRFLNRSATSGDFNEVDFTTWDLPRLFRKIGGLFDEVLLEEEKLQAVPITDFQDFLEAGNQPDDLRPTLFDFFAQQALEFYTSGEQAAASPEDAFVLEAAGPVLDELSAFLAWEPKTTDLGSPKLKAVRLFQRLAKHHLSGKNLGACLDVDLARLRWAANTAVGETRGERYRKQLALLASEYKDHPLSSLALAYQAREWQTAGENLAAYALADEGRKRFPQSNGGNECENLIRQLEARALAVQCERVAGRPLPELKIEYTNIDQVHFRLIAVPDWKKLLNAERYSPETPEWEERKSILQARPTKEWQVKLPPTPDYRPRSEIASFPEMPPGFYYLAASWKDDFSDEGNAVRLSSVWVTSLAVVIRSRNEFIEGLTVDNESGEPLSGVKIDFFEYVYKGWLKKSHYWEKQASVQSNTDGFFRVNPNQRSLLAVVHARGETFFDEQALNAYAPGRSRPNDQVFFFTDRSLYRPGQTVQFKGLAVRVDQNQDQYKIIPGCRVTVVFRDPNHQEVARMECTTNEFGSFSGTFPAPIGRLTGAFSIHATSHSGGTSIRIEEYKRPKFQVFLDLPAEGGKLGEIISLSGEAKAFTGAAVDGARIKYRVVREVRMPWWWYSWNPPTTKSQEIAHGTLTTAVDGKFRISFPAVPDRSVPEKDQPTFLYRVSVDVTDSAGETRSASQQVRLGYVAMEINLALPPWKEARKAFPLTITTQTLDGKGIPAQGAILVHRLKGPKVVMRRPFYAVSAVDCSKIESWDSGEVVHEDVFATDGNTSAGKKITLLEGAYRLIVRGKDAFGKEVISQANFLVIDPEAQNLTILVPSEFWVPNSSVEVGDTFTAIWGTGYSSGRAFVELEHRGKIKQSYWTPAASTKHRLSIPVTEELRGGFTVRVTQIRENRAYTHSQSVSVPWTNKVLSLSFEHFTSKLQPGQKDSWSLRIKGPGAEMKAVEMAAALYDASLDAFNPHSWPFSLNVFRQDSSFSQFRFSNGGRTLQHIYDSWNPYFGSIQRTYRRFPAEIINNFMGYEMPMSSSRSRKMSLGAAGMAGEIRTKESAKMDMSVAPANSPAFVSQEASSAPMGGEMKEKDSGKIGADDSGKQQTPQEPDLSKVSARSNLSETAFFFPHLMVEKDGTVKMSFTMPEALTTWKFLGFAHGINGEGGGIVRETVTQKELMVQPNPPRFLRERDTIEFSAKVTNLSDAPQTGKIRLSLSDPATEGLRNADFGLNQPDLAFSISAKESKAFSWRLKIPDGPGVVAYKVVAASEKFSDGEEAMLPVLSCRIYVKEAMPLPIRGPGVREFTFKKLLESGTSDTLVHRNLTVQMTSNPAWYAVQALPYLMEFPHECAEQIFNRLYANSLARFIAASDPKIRRVFDAWKAAEAQGGKALLSNLEKNEDLKNVLLLETPYVCQAKSESEAKQKIGLLFDSNRMSTELDRAMQKLAAMQFGDGSFPWFPGGRPDPFISLYITTGFGRLRHLGVKPDLGLAIKAVGHLDTWIDHLYREILRHGHSTRNNLSSTIAFFLYGRSFFLEERPIPATAREAVDYFLQQGREYWVELDSRLSQGHLALGLYRFGDREIPKKIGASLKERSVNEDELGRFWRDTEMSWWWYRAPIETQAIMIEVFDEVMKDSETVEDCKVWLLKQKQTQDWKTTKATADAIYALLLKGADLLASDKLVKVSLAGVAVTPENVEAGTGFYEKRFSGTEIKAAMGAISVEKEDKGVAWGGVHWEYLEDMSKVTSHDTNLKLKKTLFVKKDSVRGPEIHPVTGTLAVGDLVVIRIELRTDRDMEYVHMKDGRGCGLEPVDVLSEYKHQDGLRYYQSTKDTATHFFIDYLPKGTYVFEYNLRVQHRGLYQSGIAEIQCMYAPEFGSHSESFLLTVKD